MCGLSLLLLLLQTGMPLFPFCFTSAQCFLSLIHLLLLLFPTSKFLSFDFFQSSYILWVICLSSELSCGQRKHLMSQSRHTICHTLVPYTNCWSSNNKNCCGVVFLHFTE